MPLSSLCGLLTLQVGVTVLSAIMLTLVGVILAANIFDYHNASEGWPISLVLLLIFVVILFIIGVLMFASSYSESRSLAMAALVLIVILLCYWVILCCFSFVSNPDHVNAMCIDARCPESFWIANLGFRKQHLNITTNTTVRENSTTAKRKRSVEKDLIYGYLDPKRSKRERQESALNFIVPKHFYNTPFFIATNASNSSSVEETTVDEESRFVFGFPFIGAIFLFVANLIFLIFCALILWGWASELDWADYFIEDEPVIVYEETPY